MSLSLFTSLAGAEFSPCRTWRYRLWRTWDTGLPQLGWVMCNPSDGNEDELDPTLRRVRGFTMGFGFGGFVVVNLFGLVDSDPDALLRADDPIGPDNDAALLRARDESRIDGLVAGWGKAGGKHKARVDAVLRLLQNADLWSLGTTQEGHPLHPLYLPGDLQLERWP
jgi:hypothetical protein